MNVMVLLYYYFIQVVDIFGSLAGPAKEINDLLYYAFLYHQLIATFG